MGENIILSALLVLIAGYFNGTMDHLMFHDSEYSPANTWKAKYKKDSEGNLIPANKSPWYYLGLYTPKYVEAFPFSTTMLVAFTDQWHRNKLLCFASLRTALVLVFATYTDYGTITYIGVWVGLWVIQALGFHLKYTLIK